eukprot:symbB.v1.2.021672.t1/scaffold1886.1/size97136/11
MRIIVPEGENTCSCASETCEVCHGRKVIGSLLGQLETAPVDPDAGQQLLAMLQPMQSEWLWNGEMDPENFGYLGCDYMDYVNYLEPWSDGGSSASQLEGDETLIGPDGAVYDVFYPSKSGDEKEETSTTCSDCAGSPVPMSRQRSAETSIAGVLDFMRSTALARYPARVQLYEKVCSAAKTALGAHFGRMALIGSTALRIDTPDSDLDVVVYTCTSALKQKTFCGARHFIMFPKIRDSSIFVWFFVWFLPCLSIFPMISHVFPHVSWLVSLQCFSASMLSHLGSQLSTQPP